jgi:hypothetical protein
MDEQQLRRVIREAAREGAREGIITALGYILGAIWLAACVGFIIWLAFTYWADIIGTIIVVIGALVALIVATVDVLITTVHVLITYPGLAAIAAIGIFGVVLVYRIVSEATPESRPAREPPRFDA